MGVFNLFSNRNKPLPDVFKYDQLPDALRAQIVHIIRDTMGPDFNTGPDTSVGWEFIAKTVACEHGLLNLPETSHTGYAHSDAYVDSLNYILKADVEKAIDMIEFCVRIVDKVARGNEWSTLPGKPDDMIEELNVRFRRHGVGYQYEGGMIVRVDSQIIHKEAVVPALALLREKGFEGPNEEFLSAHEHFRHRRHEEAITDACKAFESTMKAICASKKWKVDPKLTAGGLIKVMIEKSVVPKFSEEHLQNLDKVLVGLATVRNNNGGHGAGSVPRDVPEHLAAYALHLAASNIVFLVEGYKAL